MAKLRKFCAYKRLERPYTRTSKFRKKSFIRVRPHSKIVKYHMGDLSRKFDMTFDLLSKQDVQLRHNSIESGRLACNRYLEKNLGKKGFYFEIRVFPHHILRENPLASGAGADRMSTGMKKSFGKPIGVAAQLRIGSPIFSVSVSKNNIVFARDALKRASKKLSCTCSIVERKVEVTVKSKKQVKEIEKPVEKKPAVPLEEAGIDVIEEQQPKTAEEKPSEPAEKVNEEKVVPIKEKPAEPVTTEEKPVDISTAV